MAAALGVPVEAAPAAVDTAAITAAVDEDWQWLVGQAAMDAAAAGKAEMGAATTEQATVGTAAVEAAAAAAVKAAAAN